MLTRLKQKRILIIEDNPEHQIILRSTLGDSPLHDYAQDLRDARNLLNTREFDIVLLDLLLPDGHGFEVFNDLQKNKMDKMSPPAILILSAKNDVSEKVLGFSLGAKDFITKPFNPLELQARILARIDDVNSKHSQKPLIEAGNLSLNTENHEVTLMEQDISLTFFEVRLLRFFLKHKDQVIDRPTLLDEVWGDQNHVLDRSVDSAISGLRKKLKGWDHRIKSVYGAGYKLQCPPTKSYT